MNTQWAHIVIGIVALCSVGITFVLRIVARRLGIVDAPGESRKIHTKPIPLLGGVAVGLSFIIGVALLWPQLTGGYLLPKHLVGILAGVLLLMIGGALDDRYNFPPQKQIVAPVLAAFCVVAAGIGIEYITNPFGGVWQLDVIQWQIFSIGDTPYYLTILADAFAFVWIMGMMYTTKFLDGLDGLVSGVSVIGLVVLFVLSISEPVLQPETAWLALIGAASFGGFLVWNWNPASIFLGESGSLIAGFLLGTIAIVSGGKIATALLIMGIPVMDVVWVILRRAIVEGRSPFQADRQHLHLRLLDAGLSQKQAALFFYAFTIAFGLAALYLHSFTKLIALGALAGGMLLTSVVLVRRGNR